MTLRLVYSLFVLSAVCGLNLADENSHKYNEGESVIIWANTVGPYQNRQETYQYYSLPFCKGEHEHKRETIGEALQGIELVNSGITLKFREPQSNSSICPAYSINAEQITLFRYAVANNYWYQLYLDDLPVREWVGEYNKKLDVASLYTHRHFMISYNQNRIIGVNLSSTDPVLLPKSGNGMEFQLDFRYSVEWIETTEKFEDRFDRYLDSDFFEHKIHWFSIINAFMMVIFLTGLVAIILMRALRRDFARYDKETGIMDLDRELGDEYGWKQIHGDVFRTPPLLILISAFLGTGVQFLLMIFCVVLFTILGDLYIQRSSILTASIFVYAVTSVLAGYMSASYYRQYNGKHWIKTMLLTAGLVPATMAVVALGINFIAISYESTRAIPIGVMCALLAIFIFMVFPLTLLGSILGRNYGNTSFPTRTNPIPRPLPEKQWYFKPIVLILLGGLLPFGSIFIEMYFIFTSFWQYKIYYVYGFMLLVILILVTVTACVTIVAIYFLLNAEDHQWHWVSFFTGGSIAFYIYLYSIYYFLEKTMMYGLFQTAFYFGYTALGCFMLFIMMGTVGHLAAQMFIKKIYTNVKID